MRSRVDSADPGGTPRLEHRRGWDRSVRWTLRACAALTGAIVVVVVAFLVVESLPALGSVGPLRFATDPSWHPAASAGAGTFGLGPMVAGTLLATLGAVALAGPLGLASALFGYAYAPPSLARIHRRVVELLAGIPSVVYGFWGLVVVVPLIGRIRPPGTSILTASLILALMILPTIALVSEAALVNVPARYLRGASALGLSRWTTIRGVVLPAARSGLFTALLLGVARAVGETMAVLMVAGNVVRVPDSLFAPVRTLTANMALEMAYALGDHRSALFVSGLVLMVVVVVLVLAAERLGGGRLGA